MFATKPDRRALRSRGQQEEMIRPKATRKRAESCCLSGGFGQTQCAPQRRVAPAALTYRLKSISRGSWRTSWISCCDRRHRQLEGDGSIDLSTRMRSTPQPSRRSTRSISFARRIGFFGDERCAMGNGAICRAGRSGRSLDPELRPVACSGHAACVRLRPMPIGAYVYAGDGRCRLSCLAR